MKKLLATLAILLLISVGASADQARVVASTPWTAAFARAAGATDVVVLAPSSLPDPTAYALSAADLDTIRQAEWVVYSGSESFAGGIEGASRGNARLLQVRTENSPENIGQETARIAALLGTADAQANWLGQFQGIASRVKAAINAAYPEGTRAVSYGDHVALAQWVGFEIVGQINEAGLSDSEISALAAKRPEIVLDSYRQPTGTSLAEKAGALHVQLINEPGPGNTATLEDILRYNQDRLVSYALPEGEKSSAETALPLMAAIAGVLLLAMLLAAWRLRGLAKS